MTERLTCKKDCYYWNDYDQDCECLGENHPCPRKCRIFKEKYPEKIQNKKRNYGESATIRYEITKHDKSIYNSPAVELLKKIDELEKNLAGTEQAVQESIEINEELKADNKRLQEQIKEANTVICGLYHLTTDKKAASGVVCDYLVKYGKPFETESGVKNDK